MSCPGPAGSGPGLTRPPHLSQPSQSRTPQLGDSPGASRRYQRSRRPGERDQVGPVRGSLGARHSHGPHPGRRLGGLPFERGRDCVQVRASGVALWRVTAIDLRLSGRYAKLEAITGTGATETAALAALVVTPERTPDTRAVVEAQVGLAMGHPVAHDPGDRDGTDAGGRAGYRREPQCDAGGKGRKGQRARRDAADLTIPAGAIRPGLGAGSPKVKSAPPTDRWVVPG